MLNGNVDVVELTGSISEAVDLNGSIASPITLDGTINPVGPPGPPGTTDYKELENKPQINSVELIDNKSLDDLNIQVKGDYPDEALTNTEIEEILNNFA